MKSKNTFFAENLRVLRKVSGMSQEALSYSLGISRSKIASYESRSVEPKLWLLLKIAAFYRITVDDLINSKITDHSLSQALKNKQDIEDSEDSFEIMIDLNKENVLKKFTAENEKVNKIVNGFRAMNQLRDRNESVNDGEHLIEVMDHLLTANRKLIMEINATILK